MNNLRTERRTDEQYLDYLDSTHTVHCSIWEMVPVFGTSSLFEISFVVSYSASVRVDTINSITIVLLFEFLHNKIKRDCIIVEHIKRAIIGSFTRSRVRMKTKSLLNY